MVPFFVGEGAAEKLMAILEDEDDTVEPASLAEALSQQPELGSL